jgi:hypothetical protein
MMQMHQRQGSSTVYNGLGRTAYIFFLKSCSYVAHPHDPPVGIGREHDPGEPANIRWRRDGYIRSFFGIRPKRAWREAVVRYLAAKAGLRSIEDLRRLCRKLDRYLDHLFGYVGIGEVSLGKLTL